MHRARIICIAVLLLGSGVTCGAATPTPLSEYSIAQLKQRLGAINRTLEQLASYSLRGGVGSVGYRSKTYEEPNNTEWIRIELGEDIPIDQVVMVPTLWRDQQSVLKADGFPAAFKLIAGKSGETDGTVIAHYQESDRLLPRIAPLVVPCHAVTASWVKLEVTSLSPRIWDNRFVLQLSEIMVFSGEENVALQQTVQVPAPTMWMGDSRHERFLVDGFVPYLMSASTGEKSHGYFSKLGIGKHPALTIDLGATLPVNRIHLHTPDLSDTIPQALPDGFAIPQQLLIEGANRADFSDAISLVEYHKQSIYDTGPIIMRRFAETPCRYIRLTAISPFIDTDATGSGSRIGFGEIELFSNGRNVALGKSVSANFGGWRLLNALTDGNNFYGTILPLRGWMPELALRHDLEIERPMVASALQRRYDHQKTNLRRMVWLAALLAVGIGFTILINGILRQRVVYQTRERIAANLHDELGANLHAIGLLGDLVKNQVEANAKQVVIVDLVNEIRSVSDKTSAAARTCTNMLETPGLYDDLLADMTKLSNLLLADLEHDISFQGADFLRKIRRRTSIDFYLFYKECLINILRHSEATRVTTRVTATNKQVCLTVNDNGTGLSDNKGTKIPPSLKRRARLLGAKLSTAPSPSGGTSITLTHRRRRLKFRK